jgi:hypothetical protein
MSLAQDSTNPFWDSGSGGNECRCAHRAGNGGCRRRAWLISFLSSYWNFNIG